MGSIFTKIIKGEIKGHILAESDDFIAFLDVNPLVEGHALVVPKKEVDYIFDLPERLLSGILPFAKDIARAIEKVVSCERIGISVIGLEVPHAHVHLIPMDSVGDMNFSKPKFKASDSELSELANKIKKYIKA